MTKPGREALDLYYKEAGSWAEDRAAADVRSRRIAWRVAGGACVVALVEGFALLALVPLKTVEPYTLLVDRQTGYVEALKPIGAEKIAPDTALTRSFLVQYVIARESFDIATLQSNYRKVALWSAQNARGDYVSSVQASNPTSPLATLPRTSLVDTRVKSVSPLSPSTALIRFDTIRRDAAGPPQPPRAWVAVVGYRFSDAPLSQEDRFVNPLGFQVTGYRRDQESLPAAAELAVSAPVAVIPAMPVAQQGSSDAATPVAPGALRPMPGQP